MRSLIMCLVLCLSMLCGAVSAQTPAGTIAVPSLQFNWVPPIAREDGTALPVAEIGGYEIRYRLKGANAFTYLVIDNGAAKSYSLNGLVAGDYEFQIAAFDADGLYSPFVAINYRLTTAKPKPVTNVTVKKLGVDVVGGCVAPGCKVFSGDGR